ncbi:MAG TPA: tetratricopeptide repeat protein [Cellvibrio sp.]|nr:tetratricopeptide repeat protein [Cellvibrio sp.]
MTETNPMRFFIPAVITLCLPLVVSCSSTEPQEATLRDLDIQSSGEAGAPVFVKAKNEAEVKKAYTDYLKTASSEEKGRRMAMGRLAELEMAELNKLEDSRTGTQVAAETTGAYRESIQRTINLLSTSLSEYPNAKDNDRVLYQLAQNYEKLDLLDDSLNTLTQLTTQFPQSPYYAEAQFRLAENAFVLGDYLTAESAYSEVIFTAGGNEFYERALLKRGWARYKQGLFSEASEDYIATIKHRKFAAYETLAGNEKDDFDEYFRALALATINLGNTDMLKDQFTDASEASYLYHAHQVISSLYLSQQRYTEANETLNRFIASNPTSDQIPEAYLQQIEVLKRANLTSQFESAMEAFYNRFNAKSSYWDGKETSQSFDNIKKSMRDNMLLIADAQQQEYRKTKKPANFAAANEWYKRYLNQYSSYARKDKVYTAYAELLTSQNMNVEALGYFEKAAYDGDIVLDKEAAYATIDLTDKLYQAQPDNPLWLDKHLTYSLRSVQLYQTEPRYQQVSLHAVELAYNNKRYADAIAFADSISGTAAVNVRNDSNYIKGLAYLKSNKPEEAEKIFTELLLSTKVAADKTRFANSLALAIYQQAQADLSAQKIDSAINNYARVAKQASGSDIAPDSLYEAINLSVKNERWNQAVATIELFQQQYPKHRLYQDATRQLSTAYVQLGQGDRAAVVFEKISAQDNDQNVKMAALWQAAELYESKNNWSDAIRAYTTYADSYTTPYAQYLESMNKLSALYLKQNQKDKAYAWQQKIATVDKQTVKSYKTDRTNYIAANATLALAKTQQSNFEKKHLVEPLAQNLRDKKKFMQDAISLFGQASSYNIAEVTTEATYSIGKIYQVFSKSLLDSERPKNLSGDELEQYNILIEDQAFPFEEKAIEFYEINMSRTADGTQSTWIKQSHSELQTLFPSRYQRQGKIGIYRSSIH